MATTSKRQAKENLIIDAAERIFTSLGFSNAKMEDVAKEAGVSKGLVYFYFNSKENLFMAITYRAFQQCTDMYYEISARSAHLSGLDCVLSLMKGFTDFCIKNVLYSEAMLEYISLARANQGAAVKLTDAIKDSIYFQKTQDIQSIPISLVMKEIKRGVADGSIVNKEKPELIYLTAWAMVIGFIKLITLSGNEQTTILKMEVSKWQEFLVDRARAILVTP